MDTILKDIQDIMFDIKQVEARVGEYRQDADRGINVNHTAKAEVEPKEKTIERLFYYLIDAKDNLGFVQTDLRDIHDKLDALMEIVEYEKVRKEAGL
jgi:hypothetical protein